MTAVDYSGSGGGALTLIKLFLFGLVGVIGVVIVMGLASPQTAPSLDVVRPRAHAFERHGNSALAARLAVKHCGGGLKAYKCPQTEKHATAFIFLCEEAGGASCAGLIVGSQGAEFTAWVGSCDRWSKIVAACSRVPPGATPVIQWGDLGDEE